MGIKCFGGSEALSLNISENHSLCRFSKYWDRFLSGVLFGWSAGFVLIFPMGLSKCTSSLCVSRIVININFSVDVVSELDRQSRIAGFPLFILNFTYYF